MRRFARLIDAVTKLQTLKIQIDMTTENTESKMTYDSVLTAGRSCLHLTLKKQWFDMIAKGEKKEEYRELKKYWVKRLVDKIDYYASENCLNKTGYQPEFKKFDVIAFKNGYSKDAPMMIVECKGIEIGKPKKKWCSEVDFRRDDDLFVICLGKVLFCNDLM